ncbi:hypothetical protein FB451DRAFT_1373979 [Mycena latifolia]|nr:hypothetical protein FB451DRAFT_1373979 [Mycena latifolia]
MPPNSTNIRDDILQYTRVAADALQDVSAAAQIPFLKSVCSLSTAIIPLIETTKFQKDRCLRMAEDNHRLLCALTALCIHSENISSPQTLNEIAQYAESLRKFYACLRAQNELGTIKRFFKQSEITAQLDVCERELKAVSAEFTMHCGVDAAKALFEMKIEMEGRPQELLELISARSGSFTTTTSIRGSSFNTSSGSFSLLPASPKIFHGRDSELNDLINSLLMDSARVAVLGPGGMGKTTLAMAALHHAAMVDKYNLRHFVSCESAATVGDLLLIIGLYLGLETSNQLARAVIRYFEESGPCLLVLDNFETAWEPPESRGEIEEFLSLLADVPTLTLLRCLDHYARGGTAWQGEMDSTISPTLEPLDPSASRQIFAEVADGPEIGEESALEELIDLSGSLPLAISLMASVAAFEGYTSTLSRWKVKNTTLLSDGHDKHSNLEMSIDLLLGSPRISASPDAKNLLSLLSILPDGITDEDLIISKVPLPNVAQSKSSLLRTSMAYEDGGGRLKALSPIREYIKRVYPPSVSLSSPLCTYFQELFTIWDTHRQLPSANLVRKIVSCLGNINGLMLQGLIDDQAALLAIGHSILLLNGFSHTMLKGSSSLTQHIPCLIEITGDSRLRWSYACATLNQDISPIVPTDAELLIAEGFEHFNTVQCHIEEAIDFYIAAAYFYNSGRKLQEATKIVDLVLLIVHETNQARLKFRAFSMKCLIALAGGDASQLLKLVREARTSAGLKLQGFGQDCLSFEANAHLQLGNFSQCLTLCTKFNELEVANGLEGADCHLGILDIQAVIHWAKSEYSEAREIQALVASKTSPNCSPRYHANALASLAYLDIGMSSSNEDAILRHLDGAKALYRAYGSQRSLLCSWVEAEWCLYRKDIQNARVAFEECLSKSRGIYSDVVSSCLAALGDPRHKMPSTSDWTFVYFSHVQKLKDRVATFHALRCLADIFAASDDEETALNLYHTVLEGATEIDIHRLRAESMTGIGDIMMRRGDSVLAKEVWDAARPLFVRSSQMKDAAAIDERLAQLSQCIPENPAHPGEAQKGGTVSGTSAPDHTSKQDPDTAETMGQIEKLDLLAAPKTSPLMDEFRGTYNTNTQTVGIGTRIELIYFNTYSEAQSGKAAASSQVVRLLTKKKIYITFTQAKPLWPLGGFEPPSSHDSYVAAFGDKDTSRERR